MTGVVPGGPGPRGAQEVEAPAPDPRQLARVDQDRRIGLRHRAQGLARHARRRPGHRLADRDEAAVGVAAFARDARLALDQRHLVAVAQQVEGGGDADHAAAQHDDLHGRFRYAAPSRPARSWTYCQATRPERAPRVCAHSSASRRRRSGAIVEAVVVDVALDHREVVVLRAGVEAEPEAEAVGQRDLLLDRLARVDRGLALVLDHLARHQVAAVRGRVEQHVVGPALDAALEHRLQRLVGGVAEIEAEVVAEQQKAALAARRGAAAGAAGRRCPRGGSRSGRARPARAG